MRLLVFLHQRQQFAEIFALGGIEPAHGEAGAQGRGFTVCGAGLERDKSAEGLAVDVAAIADFDDTDEEPSAVDGIEDTIVANAEPEAGAVCQGFAAGRDWIAGQRINGGAEPAVEGTIPQRFQEFRGALTERNRVGHRISTSLVPRASIPSLWR